MTDTPWREGTLRATHRLRVRSRPQILVSLILIAAAFPIRFPVGGGLTASLFDATALVSAILFIFLIPLMKIPRIPRPFLWLAVVSILLALVSLFWSQDITTSALYVVSSIEAFVVFIVVVTLLTNAPPTQIVRLISVFVLLLLTGSVLLWMRVPAFMPPAELDPLQGDYLSYFARLSHPFIGRSNNLAALLVIFIVPLTVWARRTGHRFSGFVAFLALAAVILTLSRGTLIAFAASIVIYVLIEGKAGWNFSKKAAAWLVPISVVGLVAISANPEMGRFFSDRFNSDGADARVDLYAAAQRAFSANWIAGAGAGVGADVHNTFMQQLTYFGLVCGVVIGILLIRVGAWWFARAHAEHLWLAHAIGVGFTAQLMSFWVESSYEGSLLRPLLWLGWALVVALFNAQRSQTAPEHLRDSTELLRRSRRVKA